MSGEFESSAGSTCINFAAESVYLSVFFTAPSAVIMNVYPVSGSYPGVKATPRNSLPSLDAIVFKSSKTDLEIINDLITFRLPNGPVLNFKRRFEYSILKAAASVAVILDAFLPFESPKIKAFFKDIRYGKISLV